MLRNYADIFALPGALKFSLSGLLARLPIAVLGIGIVLFIQGETGSYATAGFVMGTFMLVQAIMNPVVAGFVDRHGQAKVMVPVVIVHSIALAGLVASVSLHWWTALVYVFAGVAGGTVGSLGSLVRARWSHAAKSPRQLDTAFSWEAVADEILFVTGPVLVTFLATMWMPAAGVITSGVATLIGSALFYSQKSTEPPVTYEPGSAKGAVLTNSGILTAVIVQVFLGVNFGTIDVSAVAFAEARDAKALAGVALSCFAAGSLIAGAVYGAIEWKIPVHLRFAGAVALLCLGSWTLIFAESLVVFGIMLFGIGFAIAPSLIGASSVIQSLAPKKRLTEALAWIGTALGFGVSIGSAVTGWVVEHVSIDAALWIPGVCTTFAALVAFGFVALMDPARNSEAARAERTIID